MQNDPDTLLIDVRNAADIAATGKIPGSVKILLGTLAYKADNELPEEWRDPRPQDRSRPIIASCILGLMAALGG